MEFNGNWNLNGWPGFLIKIYLENENRAACESYELFVCTIKSNSYKRRWLRIGGKGKKSSRINQKDSYNKPEQNM